MQVFRRSPLSKSLAASDSSPSEQAPIPKDEPANAGPLTPVPVPLTPVQAFSTTNWNDPPSSWTSSLPSVSSDPYDINAKYTTANQSYRHRHRKSSLITNLIARQNDPYQPTYHDWRVRPPDSLRGSFSLNSGISTDGKVHTDGCKSRSHSGRWAKTLVSILLVFAVVCSGLWIFEVALSIPSIFDINNLVNPFGGTFAGDIFGKRPHLELNLTRILNSLKPPQFNFSVKRPEWRQRSPGAELMHFAVGSMASTSTPTTAATSTIQMSSKHLLWATPMSVTTVTKRPAATAKIKLDAGVESRNLVPLISKTRAVEVEESVTVVGQPVQVRWQDIEGGQEDVGVENVEGRDVNADEGVSGQQTEITEHPTYVEELFRKHARMVTPVAEGDDEDGYESA